MQLVAIDFETYYDADYSLTGMSVFSYVHDPRFDAYLVSVHGDDIRYVGEPGKFDWSRLDGMTPCAHNAAFDLQVYDRLVELGVVARPAKFEGSWICTADMVAYLGCKRDLKTASKFLLGEEISKAVRSKAKGKGRDELLLDIDMLEYGGKDAELCFRLASLYLGEWPEKERRVSVLNRETAMRGFALDIDLVNKGIAVLTPQLDATERSLPWLWETEESTGCLVIGLDGEPVRVPKKKALSPGDLRAYGESVGVPVPASTSKQDEEFAAWVEADAGAHPWVTAVGQYRSTNTLINRISSLRDGYDPKTGRFPYEKKYFGAFTGRFSGGSATGAGGKFNMENMPRNVMFGVDVRPMFIAPKGKLLIISDYSQVEARCLLWRAKDEAKLAPLRGTKKSVYQAYAEATGLAEAMSDLKHDNPPLYFYVKAKVLAGGYQSGASSFRRQARVLANLVLTEEEAARAVYEYRADNPRVVQYWYDHHDMLLYSTRRGDDTHQVELASGRVLTYWNPSFGLRGVEVTRGLGCGRTNMYGGKLTENEIQATCRDILCDAWLALDAAGYSVSLTVHDEIVVEVPEDEAKDRVSEVERLMTTSSPWAEGLPLGVETMISKVYRK